MLKSFFKAALLLSCVTAMEVSMAQAILSINSSRSNLRLDQTSMSMSVSNCGFEQSVPITLKFWLSLDQTFDDFDEPVEASFDFVPARRVGQVGCPGRGLSKRFELPLPDRAANPALRLNGDNREPREWLGQPIYYRACYTLEGAATPVCREGPFERRVVISPRAKEIVATRVGDSDRVELSWRVPPEDDGVPLESDYRINYYNYATPQNLLVASPSTADLEIVQRNNEDYYRFFIDDVALGQDTRFYPDSCIDVGSGPLCDGFSGASGDQEVLFTQFQASEAATSTSIDISWVRFRSSTPGYVLERCEEDGSNCVELQSKGTQTSYTDSDSILERGKRYTYLVKPCSWYGNPEQESCVSLQFPGGSGITNPGFIGNVDGFEDDDTAEQATLVRGNVSQRRSFDVPLDEDWLRLELETAQIISIATSGPTAEDTEITLFDADLNQIDFSRNTPGVATGFATLVSERLAAGVYFARITQGRVLPPRVVANYDLTVNFAQRPKIPMTAILDLLLSE